MLASRPAHPVMAAIGFGGSVAAAMWLLPVDRPFGPDPLLLPAVTAGSSIAGGLLIYAMGWRVVAAATSTLILACLAGVHFRIQRGSWSGPPLALLPLLILATASWIPRPRPRGLINTAHPHDPTRTRVITTRRHRAMVQHPPIRNRPPPGTINGDQWARPPQVTIRLNGRWAVLGSQRLPGADPSGHSQVHLALDTWRHSCHVVAKLPGGPDLSQSRARLTREAALLLALRSNPHVVRLLEAGHDRSTNIVFLILAHYPQGSLAGRLAVTTGFELGWRSMSSEHSSVAWSASNNTPMAPSPTATSIPATSCSAASEPPRYSVTLGWRDASRLAPPTTPSPPARSTHPGTAPPNSSTPVPPGVLPSIAMESAPSCTSSSPASPPSAERASSYARTSSPSPRRGCAPPAPPTSTTTYRHRSST